MIEKHFTDDIHREGPDHPFSMTPATWREMVDRTRELELALGSPLKRVEANEVDTVVVQRRSLRFARDLPAGTVLTLGLVGRPASGSGGRQFPLRDRTGSSGIAFEWPFPPGSTSSGRSWKKAG